MTPKEKAEELYYKYANEFNFDDTYRGYKEQSKQCAIIAVNEIIKFGNQIGIREPMMYWHNVKQEIEKL